jgi:hypothetical protein
MLMEIFMHRLNRIALLICLATLAACATSQPRTEITRFHLNQPIPAEAVLIEAAASADPVSLEYQTYEQYVTAELSKLGFVAGDASADLVAEVGVSRGLQAVAPKRSPVSVGVGGGSYGGSSGVSGGVSFPVGGSSGGERYVTELKVTLIKVSTKSVLWEGTVRQESETAPASPAANMQALAQALFAGFPGESGKTQLAE